MRSDTSWVCLDSTSPTVAPGCLAPTSMNELIQMSFSNMARSNWVLSSTLHDSPALWKRSAAA